MNTAALEIIAGLPKSTGDYTYGLGEPFNAFVFKHYDKIVILPDGGGALYVDPASVVGEDAPFAD